MCCLVFLCGNMFYEFTNRDIKSKCATLIFDYDDEDVFRSNINMDHNIIEENIEMVSASVSLPLG